SATTGGAGMPVPDADGNGYTQDGVHHSYDDGLGTGGTARCVVNTLGNELCGDAAIAWCNATQPLRDQVMNDPNADTTTMNMIDSTNLACASVGASGTTQ